ncbi:MAG: hypothetical protein HN494_03805 [Opitutae bacterium]|nr:hypothetical protein [Opitutae bacterium]MBT6851417.1 hypothetical protein [Opitutae bacterium]MBT7743317.1 hypothetical protein [Opitutae bacterium]
MRANPAGGGNRVFSLFVIASKGSKRTDVAIQSGTLSGMPGDAVGCLRDRWIAESLRSSRGQGEREMGRKRFD